MTVSEGIFPFELKGEVLICKESMLVTVDLLKRPSRQFGFTILSDFVSLVHFIHVC